MSYTDAQLIESKNGGRKSHEILWQSEHRMMGWSTQSEIFQYVRATRSTREEVNVILSIVPGFEQSLI
jgi:hypothetical protein